MIKLQLKRFLNVYRGIRIIVLFSSVIFCQISFAQSQKDIRKKISNSISKPTKLGFKNFLGEEIIVYKVEYDSHWNMLDKRTNNKRKYERELKKMNYEIDNGLLKKHYRSSEEQIWFFDPIHKAFLLDFDPLHAELRANLGCEKGAVRCVNYTIKDLVSKYPKYTDQIRQTGLHYYRELNSCYNNTIKGSCYRIAVEFREAFPTDNRIVSDIVLERALKDFEASRQFWINYAHSVAKGIKDMGKAPASTESSDSYVNDNRKEVTSCENSIIPDIVEESGWDEPWYDPLFGSKRSYIKFKDGISGYIFKNGSGLCISTDGGTQPHFYKDLQSVKEALYKYKKCGIIVQKNKL